jgi:cobalamin biosynthesis protein CobT
LLSCPKDNVIYELKAFSEKGVGIIPTFYDVVRHYDLCAENFDLAAIKVASSRLLRHPSANRKLLIVLSDGNPCCRNNTSERILSEYIRHVSSKHPVFGIGIQNPHISSLYPHSVNVTDLAALGSEVLRAIRHFVLQDAQLLRGTNV